MNRCSDDTIDQLTMFTRLIATYYAMKMARNLKIMVQKPKSFLGQSQGAKDSTFTFSSCKDTHPSKAFFISLAIQKTLYISFLGVFPPKSFLCLARKSHSAQSQALTIMHQNLKPRNAAPDVSSGKRKACAGRREISFPAPLRQSISLLAPEISGAGYMDSSLV